jgi:regulator of protease activity HflC (stomatin/prohibitin superfamily)
MVSRLKLVPLCACGCFCFWLIFLIVALAGSFKSLEQGSFALELVWATQKIGIDVHDQPGMKMVGLGNKLVVFPSTYQSMYFVDASGPEGGDGINRGPIHARSKDGLDMTVSLSFQWKLDASALHDFYGLLGNHMYDATLVRFARGAVVKSCADYTASMFFTNRTMITSTMFDNLMDAFDMPGVSVTIKGLQLREVALPKAFDAEIGRTQQEMQDVEVARAQRQEAKIAMERKIINAEAARKKLITEKTADATALLTVNEATVEQAILWQRKQAEANRAVLNVFRDDSNPFDKLFEVMEVWAMKKHKQKKLFVEM